MLGRLAAVCAVAALDVCAAPPPGYRLAWADEFDGATLDTNKWSYRGLGERHDAVNVPNAVSLGGGHLTITTYTAGGKHYTGMIGTEGKFERRFGYWEARLKFEDASGQWSAFWIQTPTFSQLPGDPAKAGMEIDVVEHRAVDRHDKKLSGQAQHTVHWAGSDKAVQSRACLTGDLGLDQGFHTYGCEWTETAYRFFVDDKLTWTASAPVSERNQYVILSSEVEDHSWAGSIPAGGYGSRETSQTRLVADYVRFYERSSARREATQPSQEPAKAGNSPWKAGVARTPITPIQVWQFGQDLTFVALGGEAVVDYSLRLKRELGAEQLWVAGYCNDLFAYVPSLRVLQEGGYEGGDAMIYYVQPGPFAPSIEEAIIRKIHDLVGQVRGE